MKQGKRVIALLLSVLMILTNGTNAFAMPKENDSTVETENNIEQEQNENERSMEFNDNWRFFLGEVPNGSGKEFDDSTWRKVTLPHDWSIELPFDIDSPGGGQCGYLNGGTGWYRKNFILSEDMNNKSITIDFDGVYMDSTVYVNGTMVGNYPLGYSPFSYDITDLVKADGVTENTIAVKVVNKQPSSRWYSGSGIYRNVNLTVTDPIHVSRYGTYVTTPDLAENYGQDKAVVEVETKVKNDSQTAKSAIIKSTIYDENGEVFKETEVSEEKQIQVGQEVTFKQNMETGKPELWGVETPNLYKLVTEVEVNGAVVDTYQTTFGFRWYEFDANEGFSLNGEYMKLQGVCMHHDQGALGAVSNYRAVERQMLKMKEMGANAIRVTHNPASTELLDICNKLGLMVIEEGFDTWWASKVSFDFGRFFEKPATHPEAKDGITWGEFDLQNMINRGKNEPSIIMWSIGNEIQQIREQKALEVAKKLKACIKEIDDTRPVTLGDSYIQLGYPFQGAHQQVDDSLDTVGFNYGDFSLYDRAHADNPEWAIYGSEISSAVRSRGVYAHPDTVGSGDTNAHPDLQFSSYDNDHVPWGTTASYALKNDRDRKWFAGSFIWTGFDYIGEPSHYEYPAKSSYFGIVDTAGFEKDAFYLYQSQWTSVEKNPMVHLLPHWNWENDTSITVEGAIPVQVFTNAPTVELFLNGESLGEKSFEKKTTDYGKEYLEASDGNLWLEWKVPYQKGTLKAVAKDENGNVIAEDIMQTAGQATNVKLTADKNIITADGKDLSYITVDITDENGNLVPTANNNIKFKITGNGKIVGVDNGNAATDESYKGNQRSAYNGKALVIVQSTKKAGSFTLTATSLGLTRDSKTIYTTEDGMSETRTLLGYESQAVKVNAGDKLELPNQVTAVYSDNTQEQVEVTWDEVSDEQLQKAGYIEVTGVVNGTTDKVTIVVEVRALVGAKDISVVTPIGVVPDLPKSINLVYSDGFEQETEVEWDGVELDDVASTGKFEVCGSVKEIPEYVVKAHIRVVDSTTGNVALAQKGKVYPRAITSTMTAGDPIEQLNNGIISYNQSDKKDGWGNWTGEVYGPDRTDWAGIEFEKSTLVSSVNLHFVNKSSLYIPNNIKVEYEKDGEWIQVENQSKDTGFEAGKEESITFNPVRTKKLRVYLTKGTDDAKDCMVITEMQVMGTDYEQGSNIAQLSEICIDGQPLENFDKNQYMYYVERAYEEGKVPVVTATADANGTAFVVPALTNNSGASIKVTSEDGTVQKEYVIQFEEIVNIVSAQIVLDKDEIAEDDIVGITVQAILENGKEINDGELEVVYEVDEASTAQIGIENGKLYAYGMGNAIIRAKVTYQGITIDTKEYELVINEPLNSKVVKSYSKVEIKTEKNVVPVLPARIKATFTEGLPKEVDVIWDKIPEDACKDYGTFTVEGRVEGQELRPQATITVVGYLAARNYSTVVPIGVSPKLPEEVIVYGTDESQNLVEVDWSDYDKNLLKKENTFTIDGKVKDTNLSITMTVRVSKDAIKGDNHAQTKSGFAWPMAMAYYSNNKGGDYSTYLNDGIISFEASPKNRWCDWEAPKDENPWVGVLFGVDVPEKRFIDNLELNFYEDYGSTAPQSCEIQYYVGDLVLNDIPVNDVSNMAQIPEHKLNDPNNWKTVTNLKQPEVLEAGKATEFTFDMIETYAMRINMVSQEGKSLAITELKAFEKRVEPNKDFKIEHVKLNGKVYNEFNEETKKYTVQYEDDYPNIEVAATQNASITIVPADGNSNTAKILVVAENGLNSKTYEIKFEKKSSVQVDKSLLEQKIKEADAIDLDKFLTVGKDNFIQALADAKEIYKKEDATEQEVTDAYKTLQNAIFLLREKPDKSKLEQLLKESKAMPASKYTEETYAVLKKAIASAEKVYQNAESTKEDVAQEEQNLMKAINQLEEIQQSEKPGWKKQKNGTWRYLNKNQKYATNCWQKIDQKWYCFDKVGYMMTGWTQDKAKTTWYYLKSNGAMATGWQIVDGKWYYFKAGDSGRMLTGWQIIGGKWYYLNANGKMAVGWKLVDHKWYYLNAKGDMAVGWKLVDHKWYYLNKKGEMKTGWVLTGGKWYYCNEKGIMLSSTSRKLKGKVYRFNKNGVCMNP